MFEASMERVARDEKMRWVGRCPEVRPSFRSDWRVKANSNSASTWKSLDFEIELYAMPFRRLQCLL